MLIRSILRLSSRRAVPRIPRDIYTTQIPKFHQKEFSTKPNSNQSGKPSDSGGGSASKVIIGSAVVGAAAFAAYRTGYLNQFLGGNDRNESPKPIEVGVPENQDSKDVSQLEDQLVSLDSKEAAESSASFAVNESVVEETETLPGHSVVEASSESEDEVEAVGQDKLEVRHEESDKSGEEKNSVDCSQGDMVSDDGLSLSSEASLESETATDKEEISENVSDEDVQTPAVFSQSNEAVEKSEEEVVPLVNFNSEEIDELALDKVGENPVSLLDEYNLDDADGSSYKSLHQHDDHNIDLLAAEKEALSSALEELGDAYISKDGKLVLDFLEAIHAAETRQAELDARVYAAEKKSLKDKYEKELKDAAIRELMLAEEAAMLDKDLKRERTKAAAALKSLQEQLEEKYKNELEQKKRAAETKLKKAEELAKIELAAKIASEKAAQIEKIAEANLNINALCMAFYARSEEARRSHSAHKLALGALALEDALSKGLPIQTEIGALRKDLDGIDKDSILDLVLSSLPDETRNNGTDTLLQLNQKFDALKGTLRHYSLIPPSGGGILAHSVARVASWLKVKETSESGEGIESLISKIDSCLADGKIAEAAEALEEGVRGTQASEIVGDWVRRARDRAITEQALTLLQSYATSVSAS